ncbi:ATP-binding cassette domain-containing protein [Weissella diestrammenae]|uniref:ATP-binding cassette domain-containing protein n=1 Tax=Weissella diestrammenae TaxID=1162633 RepID=A0A7G9T6J9_9LACO|nr:ATP-binding cassette domain-containing protein [Weissella diestrammenae]MCM0583220.1 ATP-binding cassette domain-containing protein [Weissella diestrammenae]QNN75724.1 ATP-binding cassette domain-containing protein [Weissella diestrammenae]
MVKLDGEKIGYQVENRHILNDMTFSYTSGDWITIIGPSGSGKSTLLKIIAGLTVATTGQIKLDNVMATDYPISDYRQQVSYATQSAQLFGNTVRDNLNLPYQVRQLVPDELVQKQGLSSMALPENYLDQEISQLSGGERQRVGVLRNLLFPPKVLLLDEISTGLDAETKAIIWQKIDRVHAQNHGIVLSVTHDESEILKATHKLELATMKEEADS